KDVGCEITSFWVGTPSMSISLLKKIYVRVRSKSSHFQSSLDWVADCFGESFVRKCGSLRMSHQTAVGPEPRFDCNRLCPLLRLRGFAGNQPPGYRIRPNGHAHQP